MKPSTDSEPDGWLRNWAWGRLWFSQPPASVPSSSAVASGRRNTVES